MSICEYLPFEPPPKAPTPMSNILKAPFTTSVTSAVITEAVPVKFLPVSVPHAPACPVPPDVHPRKGGGYHKNSSTEAKIQNDGNHNVDRTVFLGGRNDT